jgi:hypothetical protein
MCDPLTALAAGSTGLSAISKLSAGFQSSDLAGFNADLLTQVAQTQAKGVQLDYAKGALQEARTRVQVGETEGSETATFGARHLDPTSGSPLFMQGYTAAQGEGDINIIRAQTGLDAANRLRSAANTMSQAASYKIKSGQDLMAGYFGAGTALLSGASKIWGPLTAGGGGSSSYGDINFAPDDI